MKFKLLTAAAMSGIMVASYFPASAHAAAVEVKCEKRTSRSKISVDANDLAPGQYRCRVYSGPHQKTTRLLSTVGDELECDFDSNRNDIAEGATRISKGFIVGRYVTGKVLNSSGKTVAMDRSRCRIRK